METTERHRVKRRPVLLSTLSTAVAMGLAYVVYNRRAKEEDETTSTLHAPAERSFRLKNLVPFKGKRKEVYKDDSDIGYC